jgi:D-alanyl-D-alanine carboxypeptidase (penicillin-binding protein 5/6)
MLNYGFNNYKLDILLDKDNDLGNLSIIKGKKETTKIYLKDNVTILSKINDEKGTYDYNIVIEKENAPIESNEKVGYVEVIDNEGNIIKEQDLIVKEEIKKANIWDLFKKTLSTISSGNFT